MSNIAVGLTINAKDNATPVIGSVLEKLKQTLKSPLAIGVGIKLAGDALASFAQNRAQMAMAFVTPYMALEDARVGLENTLLDKNGKVSSWFEAINKEAMSLGSTLPGTTADFYQMASAMKKLDISGESIANGGLRSAAYLANVLKVPYVDAAKSIATFKNSLGVADADLSVFADDIQRVAHMGVELADMEFAFSRASGALKGLGIQGLEATRGLTPLFGILNKNGMKGEMAGTAIGNALTTAMTYEIDGSKKMTQLREQLQKEHGVVLDFTDENGKFKGVENFVAQLEKLSKLKPDAQMLLFGELFGNGAEKDTLVTLVKNGGLEGIKEYKTKMDAQASLDARVRKSLGTLGALWEAFIGTKDVVFASVVERWSDEIHGFTSWLGEATSKLGKFADAHPRITKFFGAIVLGVPLIAGAIALVLAPLGALVLAFGVVRSALGVFGLFFKAKGDVCGLGDCAKGAGGAVNGLSSALGGVGKTSLAQIGGVLKLTGALGALIALYMQIGAMGREDIATKRVVGKDKETLQTQKSTLEQRLADSKKPLWTLEGVYGQLWRGDRGENAQKELQRRISHTQRAIDRLDKGHTTQNNTYHTNVTVTNPKTGLDVQKEVQKALAKETDKQKNLTLKGGM